MLAITDSRLLPLRAGAAARQTVHPFRVYRSWEHLDRAMQALRDRRVAGKAILLVDHADEPQ